MSALAALAELPLLAGLAALAVPPVLAILALKAVFAILSVLAGCFSENAQKVLTKSFKSIQKSTESPQIYL